MLKALQLVYGKHLLHRRNRNDYTVKQTIKASLQGRYRIKRVLMFQDPGLQEFPSDDPIPAAQSQVSFKTLLRQ